MNADQRPDTVSLTQALIRVGAMSGDESGVARIVENAMHALGYDDVRVDEVGNVVGLIGPRDAPVRLLFDGHMDVVPATGTWSRDPFSGDLADGRVHGRGATDMKGPLAAAICGVAAAARAGQLPVRIAVSASVMEEVIEGAALARVLDEHAPEMVVICEPSGLELKIAQKGCIEIMVHVRGVPAHAAFPDRGTNAIALAAQAITALGHIQLPVDPVLGGMVLVPTDIVSTPYPSVSALPSAVTIRYDRRTGPGETVESVIGQLRGALDEIDPEAFDIEVSQSDFRSYTGQTFCVARDLPAWRTPDTSPLVVAARSCMDALGLDSRPGRYDFCTNGSEAAGRRGLPTIGFGPGRPEDAHVIDEAIEIDALKKATEFYANLVRECAMSGQEIR